MPTFRTDLKPKKAFWLIAVLSLIILPIINYFVLDYFEFYFSGDITKETVNAILSYLSDGLGFVLKYVAFAAVVFATHNLAGRSKAVTVVLSYVSLMIPYASLFFIACFGTTNFASMLEYYLVSTSVNLAVDYLLCTLILVIAHIIKSKSKIEIGKRLIRSIKMAALILFMAELAILVYETVDFVLELKYEYYDTMTPGEAVSVIISYISLAIKTYLGYLLMRVNTHYLSLVTESKNIDCPVD